MAKQNKHPEDGGRPLTPTELAEAERLLAGIGVPDQETLDAKRLIASVAIPETVEFNPDAVARSNADLGYVPSEHDGLVSSIVAEPGKRF